MGRKRMDGYGFSRGNLVRSIKVISCDANALQILVPFKINGSLMIVVLKA